MNRTLRNVLLIGCIFGYIVSAGTQNVTGFVFFGAFALMLAFIPE